MPFIRTKKHYAVVLNLKQQMFLQYCNHGGTSQHVSIAQTDITVTQSSSVNHFIICDDNNTNCGVYFDHHKYNTKRHIARKGLGRVSQKNSIGSLSSRLVPPFLLPEQCAAHSMKHLPSGFLIEMKNRCPSVTLLPVEAETKPLLASQTQPFLHCPPNLFCIR